MVCSSFTWKVLAVMCLLQLFSLSTFFSVFTLFDILGETNHQNFTTQPTEPPDYDEFGVRHDKVSVVNLTTPVLRPPAGYNVYYIIMSHVRQCYLPQTYRGIKLGILTVAAYNFTFTFMALIGIFFLDCIHPTSLVLVEGGYLLTGTLVVTMTVLGRSYGFMEQDHVIILAATLVLIFIQSSIVQKFYQNEKQKNVDMFDYETVSYKSYEQENNESNPNSDH